MKKENIGLFALITVLCIIMAVVYVKIYSVDEKSATCEELTNYEVTTKKDVHVVDIKTEYKTKSKRCITFTAKIPVKIEADRIIFDGTKEKEYNDNPNVNFNDKQTTITSQYATLNQDVITLTMKVRVKEKSQLNIYEIERLFILKVENGKIIIPN